MFMITFYFSRVTRLTYAKSAPEEIYQEGKFRDHTMKGNALIPKCLCALLARELNSRASIVFHVHSDFFRTSFL